MYRTSFISYRLIGATSNRSSRTLALLAARTLTTPPPSSNRRPFSATSLPFFASASSLSSSPSSSASSPTNQPLPDSPLPIFTTVKDYRRWRSIASNSQETVGFVATMGALHEGHLSLVSASLEENEHTVVSIFVNPAQFAPTEDLASYPRTLPSDVQKLASLTGPNGRKVSAAFVPSVPEMYPNGFTQIIDDQVGAFVEVKGLGHQMEGGSRPTFFRGVATVVTKLFHVIQPDRAYFGQKDIQQAVILRRLVQDLLFAHPPSAERVRVLPTGRDPETKLALSSRNAYLTPAGRKVAPVLYKALSTGRSAWEDAKWSKGLSARERVEETLRLARLVVEEEEARCKAEGVVNLRLDYISLNHPHTLENLEAAIRAGQEVKVDEGAILSGAALVSEGEHGRVTRLIDNVLLGFQM